MPYPGWQPGRQVRQAAKAFREAQRTAAVTTHPEPAYRHTDRRTAEELEAAAAAGRIICELAPENANPTAKSWKRFHWIPAYLTVCAWCDTPAINIVRKEQS